MVQYSITPALGSKFDKNIFGVQYLCFNHGVQMSFFAKFNWFFFLASKKLREEMYFDVILLDFAQSKFAHYFSPNLSSPDA